MEEIEHHFVVKWGNKDSDSYFDFNLGHGDILELYTRDYDSGLAWAYSMFRKFSKKYDRFRIIHTQKTTIKNVIDVP